MKKHIPLVTCLLMILLQIWIPGNMIYQKQTTLNKGTLFKFKTRPVDPYHPFRGKYVSLNFEEGEVAIQDKQDFKRDQTIYVTITTGLDGYAKLGEISIKKPKIHTYLNTKIKHIFQNKVQVDLDFNRFYMNEKLAPKAEKAYLQSSAANSKIEAYALVRIRNGHAVLENLILDDIPIQEYIMK